MIMIVSISVLYCGLIDISCTNLKYYTLVFISVLYCGLIDISYIVFISILYCGFNTHFLY